MVRREQTIHSLCFVILRKTLPLFGERRCLQRGGNKLASEKIVHFHSRVRSSKDKTNSIIARARAFRGDTLTRSLLC